LRLPKLTPPRLPVTAPRGRLFSLLERHGARSLTWVYGPPGAGKTTLVSSFLTKAGTPYIWYDIDAGDGDPASFFHYLREAAQVLGGAPPPLFGAEYLGDLPGFSRRFFRALLAQAARPVILAFDNFQEAAQTSPLAGILRDAAREMGPGGHMIVISRLAPPPAFARLRANQALGLIGWDDLRLDEDECGQIVALRDAGRADHAGEAWRRCGGWAAGLTLLLEHGGTSTATPAAASIDTREALFDYFAAEVFAEAPAKTRVIWLATAYLPRFTGAMAQALSGEPEAGATLDALARRRYFIDRHAAAETSYQYHGLFREFLQQWHERATPERERVALALRSARALQAQGDADAALALYERAGAWTAAAGLILSHAPALYAQGRSLTLLGWLARQPPASFETLPWLSFWRAAAQARTDPSAAQSDLAEVHARFTDSGDILGQALSACGVIECHFLQWGDYSHLNRWIEVLEAIMGAQPSWPSPSVELRVWSVFLLALTHFQPQHPLAAEAAERIWRLCRAAIGAGERLAAASTLVTYLGWTAANAVSRAAIAEFDPLCDHPEVSPLQRCTWLYSRSFSLRTEATAGEWTAAWRAAGLIAAQNGFGFLERFCAGFETWGPLTEGRWAEAAARIQAIGRRADQTHPNEVAHVHFLSAWLALALDQPQIALGHAEKAAVIGRAIAGSGRAVVVLGALSQALADCRDLDRALAVAREGVAWFPKPGDGVMRFGALLMEADILGRMDRRDAFLETLAQAMATGRRGGQFTMPPWLPKTMARLAAAALEAGIETDYVRCLIRTRGLKPVSTEIEAWPWPVRIHTLGRFAVEIDDVAPTSRGKTQKKPLELLKAVVAAGAGGVGQGELADRLWPDLDGDAARNALDVALHRLRKLLGQPNAIILADGRVSMDVDQVWVDAWTVERLCGKVDGRTPADDPAALAHRMIDVYAGHFLAGEDAPWVQAARERLRGKFARAISGLATDLEREARWAEAAALYGRCVERDPLAESFHRGLMLSLGESGRVTEALDAYRRCRDLLRAGLDAEPSSATRRLFDTLKAR
jgi:DNA-binding SARP family transcriptional activator